MGLKDTDMKKEVKNQKKVNLQNFLKNMKSLDSFVDVDAVNYVKA